MQLPLHLCRGIRRQNAHRSFGDIQSIDQEWPQADAPSPDWGHEIWLGQDQTGRDKTLRFPERGLLPEEFWGSAAHWDAGVPNSTAKSAMHETFLQHNQLSIAKRFTAAAPNNAMRQKTAVFTSFSQMILTTKLLLWFGYIIASSSFGTRSYRT